jgi:hypothetical protein
MFDLHKEVAVDRRDYFRSFGSLMPKFKVDERSMTLSFVLENDSEEEKEYTLPMRYCVCGTCGGKGRHVNPGVDANGITSSEWSDWDEEEKEAYFSGRYDVDCYECGGEKVVPEINEEMADPKLLQQLRTWQREEADYRAVRAAERRMGA